MNHIFIKHTSISGFGNLKIMQVPVYTAQHTGYEGKSGKNPCKLANELNIAEV